MNSEELLEYACKKFQEEKFDEALEAFVLAYCRGYEQEWILENIYRCYVDANQEEFRRTYALNSAGESVAYEDSLLDFIPYKEGEYYIFDKELKLFRGIFSVPQLQAAKQDKLCEQMEFSSVSLEMDWNWNASKSILIEAKNRKIYVVAHDVKRCCSFWKLSELAEYWKNIHIFSSYKEFQVFFHQHTSTYLPHLVFGTEEGQEKLSRIINLEHSYRLTPEGRNTDNVLLTIAIPTYNRGHLLLERLNNLRTMPYDAEIEIVISKNGMEKYQEEYAQAAKISDARILYHDHGKTLKAVENWRYAVSMAHGKYVLFVSDEDDVALDSLEHYFKIFVDYPEVIVATAKSLFQGAYITSRNYKKKGLDAFNGVFLRQNYLSGLIVRRADFLQEDFARLERFADNEFYMYYPHEWWCAMLSQKGDYLEEPVILVVEGKSDLKADGSVEAAQGVKDKIQGKLPSYAEYATYESRLKQLDGIVEFLHWFMKDNPKGVMIGLDAAIRKTAYLMMMARRYEYDIEHFGERVSQFAEICLKSIEEFRLESIYSEMPLETLKEYCIKMLNAHAELKIEEMKERSEIENTELKAGNV